MSRNKSQTILKTDTELETLPYEDVIEDVEFVSSANSLARAIQQLSQHLDSNEALLSCDNLDTMDSIERDLFLLYAMNSIIWVRLKLEGQDPASHPVKHHLNKVRELMQRKQMIVDKRKRPTLDPNVTKRFIRNGLWQPKGKVSVSQNMPQNKKIKFDN